MCTLGLTGSNSYVRESHMGLGCGWIHKDVGVKNEPWAWLNMRMLE